MDLEHAFNDIKSFLDEAGTLALQKQDSAAHHYKGGQDIVTETDIAISKLAHERFSHWLVQDNHILIDEESIDGIGTPSEVFKNTNYQWVLDPIDGTAGYAMGRSLWGISLGLLHNGSPLLGGIYLPAQKELLISDQNNAIRYKNYGSQEQQSENLLCKGAMEINSQTFVESYFGTDRDWGTRYEDCKLWTNSPESAVQGFFSLLTSQSAGATFLQSYSIWDVAGALILSNTSGFNIQSVSNGQEMRAFTPSHFKDNWKFTDDWLICATENFDKICEGLTGIKPSANKAA